MKNRVPVASALSLSGVYLLVCFSGSSAHAASISWSSTAGNTTWSSGGNWDGGTAPADSFTTDIAVFNKTSYANQPTVTASRNITGLVFGDGSTATAATLLTLNAGVVLRIGASGVDKTASSGALTFNGSLRLNGNQTWSNNSSTAMTVSSAGTAFTIGSNSGTMIWTLAGSGSGGITVNNIINNASGTTGVAINRAGLSAGTVTFTNANTYTGGTTIGAGTLLVNNSSGSGLGNGTITVNGGVLGGTGTISGANSNITLTSGSISPGAGGAGTLTGNGLTWNSGASMSFDLGANQAASDKLALTGAFNKGTGSSFAFNFADLGVTPSLSYTLISFGSTTFSDASVFTASGVDGTFAFSGNTLTFTVAAIPEPSAAAALTAGAGLVWTAGSRRRRRD